jgi:phosphoribosylanthranilate isomerase
MLIKVCGICNEENGMEVCQLPVDMIGFNFYSKSVRFLSLDSSIAFGNFPKIKVGIFVDEDPALIGDICQWASLDYVQLHGNETPAMVRRTAALRPVIQAMPATEKTLKEDWKKYTDCSYFLFDTPTRGFGGSGKKYNWSMLEHYQGDIPFLLSGGIGPEDYESIRQIAHPSFAGIDLNSRFEIFAGVKDVFLLSQFLKSLKQS